MIVPFVDLDGLGAGEYTLTVHVDPVADAGVARVEPETVHVRIDRCKGIDRGSSEPTAFAERPVAIRSIPRPCAGSARRWCGRCRTAPESPRLLVGRDTRESGGWIEAELAHGAAGEGAVGDERRRRADAGGRLSDADRIGYDAGVVISASHNPFEDNGIKVFSGRGEKFTERVEREVEAIVADRSWQARSGEAVPLPTATLVAAYLDHLRAVIDRPDTVRGIRLAIDCANGATTTGRAGAVPIAWASTRSSSATSPTAATSTCECGSTHPERLAARCRRARLPRWASPSTATATARSSSTSADGSSTATPCC